MEQRTDEWYQARLGKVTASRVADVMATIKTGEAAARRNYRMDLLCERLTGTKAENFVSAPMQRGIDMEPLARGMYEGFNGVLIDETGFVDHSEVQNFGCSPDGLVNDDGLLEIKCPNTGTHIEFIRTGKINRAYIYQVHAQMLCTGRNWCDFVSFDNRLPAALQYRCQRVHLDKSLADEILSSVKSFLSDLDALEAELRDRMEKAA